MRNSSRQQEHENQLFTGGTSVRSRNIFTAISRYPTGKHEINEYYASCCSDMTEIILKGRA